MATATHRRLRREACLVFGLCLLAFLPYLIAYWPGFIYPDAERYLREQSRGIPCLVQNWESYLYACGLYLASRFRADLVGFFLGQILLASFVCAYGYFVLARDAGSRIAAALVVGVALIHPGIGRLALLPDRDFAFAWLAVALFLQLIDLRNGEPQGKARGARIGLAALTALLLSNLRREGILLVLLLPVQMGALGLLRRGGLAWLTASLVTGWLLFNQALPLALGGPRPSFGLDDPYTAHNGFNNPLAYILAHRGTPVTAEERRLLSRVFDVDALLASQDDYAIGVMMKWDAPVEDRRAVIRYALRLILAHPALFLENRLKMMGRAFWQPFVHATAPPPPYLPGVRVWLDEGAVVKSWAGVLFRRPILGVLLCLLLPWFWRRLPLSASLAVGYLALLVVVFLFQGAPKSKYLFPHYLYSLFALPLLWKESRGLIRRLQRRVSFIDALAHR